LDTSIFFASGGNHDKLFTIVNTKNSTFEEFGDFPSEDTNEITDLPPMFKKMAYNGKLKYNSVLKKLVYVSIASEMFEIYNFDGSGVELAMGNYSTIPKYNKVVREGGAMGVITEFLTNGKGRNIGVTASDENIFILYQNYERAGVQEETDNKPADMILVFDWNGKPVKIYELDRFVKTITYDNARNRLWAIHDNPDPEIIYFEL
jgi:hypothetical protein